MKKGYRVVVASLLLLSSIAVHAGNKDRQGQAGASELLINPYSRSSGWAGANVAGVKGLEAQFLNVAGLAHTRRTELVFSHTSWLRGSDININAFGFSQKVGQTGVMGIGFMSMNFGDIPITTVSNPEGGLGTFSPSYSNISLSYAKVFSNSILGGINVKGISETGAADIKAQGLAIDAGIQYTTTFGKKDSLGFLKQPYKKDNVHFGISIKNVGNSLVFRGDGLNNKASLQETGLTLTQQQRANRFELPSLLNIAGAYDVHPLQDTIHVVAVAVNFQANSFLKNQFQIGLEYSFRKMFMIRGGYSFESDMFDETLNTNVLSGPTAGFTVELPMGKSGSTFGLDYCFRATHTFQGCHSIGARINL